MFICTLTDKFVHVLYKGKRYHFEHTAWCGWVCTRKDFEGAKKSHPLGAWKELKRLHDPSINLGDN